LFILLSDDTSSLPAWRAWRDNETLLGDDSASTRFF
jgi:hypothetical protein